MARADGRRPGRRHEGARRALLASARWRSPGRCCSRSASLALPAMPIGGVAAGAARALRRVGRADPAALADEHDVARRAARRERGAVMGAFQASASLARVRRARSPRAGSTTAARRRRSGSRARCWSRRRCSRGAAASRRGGRRARGGARRTLTAAGRAAAWTSRSCPAVNAALNATGGRAAARRPAPGARSSASTRTGA